MYHIPPVFSTKKEPTPALGQMVNRANELEAAWIKKLKKHGHDMVDHQNDQPKVAITIQKFYVDKKTPRWEIKEGEGASKWVTRSFWKKKEHGAVLEAWNQTPAGQLSVKEIASLESARNEKMSSAYQKSEENKENRPANQAEVSQEPVDQAESQGPRRSANV